MAIFHSVINCFNPLSAISFVFLAFLLLSQSEKHKIQFFQLNAAAVCYCQTLINCKRDKNENCFIFISNSHLIFPPFPLLLSLKNVFGEVSN